MAEEFLLAKASYKAATGREQKKETDVLCYQIRMAFYPGEITPKEANRIGYELAMWSYVKKKYKLNVPFLWLAYPAKASAFSSNAA